MSSLVACWMSDVGQRLDMFLKHVLFCCSSEQFRISQCHTIQNLPGCGAAIVYFASRWAEDKYNSGSCLWKDDCMAHCLGGKKNSPTFNMMIHAKHDLDLLICLSVQQLFSGKNQAFGHLILHGTADTVAYNATMVACSKASAWTHATQPLGITFMRHLFHFCQLFWIFAFLFPTNPAACFDSVEPRCYACLNNCRTNRVTKASPSPQWWMPVAKCLNGSERWSFCVKAPGWQL